MRADRSPPVQTIRIFLASSAELAEHRREFALFINDQNKRLVQRGMFLELVQWEDFLDAMSATRLQDEYNKALQQCELFVMLFRTKVGRYTAEEFEKAFKQFQSTGRPRIWTYFNDAPVTTGQVNRADMNSLWDFQDKLRALGHFQTNYENHDALCRHFGEQLDKLDFSPPSEPNQLDLHPYLIRRNQIWRQGAVGQLDRRFVNLTLIFDHGLEYDGPRHEAQGRYSLLADLLLARPDVGAWVLVGAPGSGKSTVLQHHEMRAAEAALQALTAPKQNTDTITLPEICIWHRLSEYGFDSPPPDDWLQLPARWPQELPPPIELRRVARVRFLLDGLNEIKAPDRARQLQAIDRWTEWAAAHASRGDLLAPIFSVRTLDQSPMSTSGFEVRQIVLSPWSDTQIEAYCAHTLGDSNALWPVIKQDRALLELSELPFNLATQCELFAALGRPARDRAELMGGLFWQMLHDRLTDAPLKVPGLLGEPDCLHIVSGQWKQTLRALPDKHGCLVPWLDDTLQRLHRRGRQISVTQDELLAGLTPHPGWATPVQWLAAVRSLNLIGDGGHDEYSTDPLLRCTHQLWQEFFAARGIRQLPLQPEQLPDLRPPALPPLHETLQKLGAQEPLPGPDPSHWEEPVKLAVQLVRDPLPWLKVLAKYNLALAGRAAVACRQKIESLHGSAVLDDLKKALLMRGRDPHIDLRLRIEATEALGNLGDPRYHQGIGPDGHRFLIPKPEYWISIPAGDYMIGSEDSLFREETPPVSVALERFYISFAPITNAEYRCFIEAGGYEDARWWIGKTAKCWRSEGIRDEQSIKDWTTWLAALRADFNAGISQYFPDATPSTIDILKTYATWSTEKANQIIENQFSNQICRTPKYWDNNQFNLASQPVVGISLFEACAYACWLSAQSHQPCRLPVEAEWEASSRGLHHHIWPWGPNTPDAHRMNADRAHLRRTSPIGAFPESDTPTGIMDLAGNVAEWTTSAFTHRHDHQTLITASTDPTALRVLRGGSWHYSAVNCRSACRNWLAPSVRNNFIGFRLVINAPIQGIEP